MATKKQKQDNRDRVKRTMAGRDALAMLKHIVRDFPGLLDPSIDVNGADLVDMLSFRIVQYSLNKDLKK